MRLFDPSRGPHGSLVSMAVGTRDEAHYVRVRGSFHRVPHHIGQALNLHHGAMYRRIAGHRTTLLLLVATALTLGVAADKFLHLLHVMR